MDKITLTIPTNVHHVSQIITGFRMLQRQGLQLQIVDNSRDSTNPFYGLPVVAAELSSGGDDRLRFVGRLPGPGRHGDLPGGQRHLLPAQLLPGA